MKFIPLAIPDVFLIEPKVFGDERGYFFESFNSDAFNTAIGRNIKFVQDNHSKSSKNVLRGLHYQLAPKAQPNTLRISFAQDPATIDPRKSSDFASSTPVSYTHLLVRF